MVWIVVEVVGGDDDARTHKKNSTESQSFLRPLIYSATTAALCSPFTYGYKTILSDATLILDAFWGQANEVVWLIV